MLEERIEEIDLNDRLSEGDHIDVWSVSALKTIGTCGKQYEFRYGTDRVAAEVTPPLAFGSAVHKCIERLHKEGDKWEPSKWQRMWNDEWYSYASQVNWEASKSRKSMFDKLGAEMLANYIENNRDAQVLEIEYKFPNQKGQQYLIGKYPIKGIIDQVRRLPNGRLLIVDLKTSSTKPDPLLLRADPQFTMYYSIVKEKYGEEPLLAWLHLKTGELIYTHRDVADLALVEEMLREGQLRVNNDMFARNIGYHCKFCPFIRDCLGVIGDRPDAE